MSQKPGGVRSEARSSNQLLATKYDGETTTPTTGGKRLLVLLLSTMSTVPSGGDRLAIELARAWRNERGPVTIFTTSAGLPYPTALRLESLGLRVLSGFRTRTKSVALAYLMRRFRAPFAMWQVVRQERPSVVFSSSPYPPDVVSAISAKALGLHWIHSWQLTMPLMRSGSDEMGQSSAGRRLLWWRGFGGNLRQLLSFSSQEISLRLARRWSAKLVVPTN